MAAISSSDKTIVRATAALSAVLPAIVEVQSARTPRGGVVIAGRRLAIAWAGEGSLADVRGALITARHPDVVVARRLSLSAIEELRTAGIGFVDETGTAEIAIGSLIVSRTGRPQARAAKPARWTPATLAVAEALLCDKRGTVASMQDAIGMSIGSCTKALRVLTDFGLLEASASRGRNSARQITDRRALLVAYADAANALRPTTSLRVGVTWRDPVASLMETGHQWDRSDLAWAATGSAAASVLAPHLSDVTTVDVYVGTKTYVGLEAVAAQAALRPIEGGRLTLRPFPTVAAQRLSETVNGLSVAPWPRVYADLLTVGVRGEEAAEHLWEVVDDR